MSQPFQLCILRLSAIGDVCHAVAMVQRVLKQRPDILITWVIGSLEYQLLKDMPRVNFVIYDKKAGKQARKSVKEALSHIQFDALFVMQVALRANWLSTVIKAKRRIGFDWARSKEGHSVFINERIAAKPHAHVLEGFMGFADKLGVAQHSPSWDMPYSDEDRQWAATSTHALGKYAVISPAASKSERNWHAKGYAQVADHLTNAGISVILCGGPGALDKTLAADIHAQTNNIALDLVGKTSLKQMLAVLADACVVIAPDTGPAHMATTVGTPVIGLYAHSNPKRTGPYHSLAHCVSVYEQCILEQYAKPWQALPWGVRAKGGNLMQRITASQVIAQVDAVLSTS